LQKHNNHYSVLQSLTSFTIHFHIRTLSRSTSRYYHNYMRKWYLCLTIWLRWFRN